MRTMVSVPFHQQNTNVLCGPACVQMVLATLSAGVVNVTQVGLFGTTKLSPFDPTETINWKSFPDGIVNALNGEAGSHGPFVLYCSRRAEDLTQIICLALRQHDSAPIVLFYDAKHWIVVRGFDWDEGAGGPFQVSGFYVHDPWPHLGQGSGLAHSAGDTCGSGRERGWPPHHILIDDWYQDKVTGVERPSRWQGLFLAICPEVQIPPQISVQVCTDGGCSPACVAADERGEPPSRNRDQRGETRTGPPIGREEAMERAQAVFAQDDFEIDPLWDEALAESAPAAPLLVERRDGRQGAYYLVPFVTEDQERAPLLVKLDAATGDYAESVAMPGGTTHTVADSTLRTLYSLERIVLEDTGEEVALGGWPDDPAALVFFWQPVAESRSPFWPFYEATVEGDRLIYIRIDGRAFSELHEAVP